MSELDRAFEGVEFLGQKFSYPRTPWAAASVGAVVAGLCAVVYILAVEADPKKVAAVADIVAMGRVTPQGHFQEDGVTRQIQFWTPSAKTCSSGHCDPWEKIDDDKITAFGHHLRKDPRVSGFRRYEVVGSGVTPLKAGWWWVLSAAKDYSLADFMGAYRSFWKFDKPVYVEVIHKGGQYEE